MLTLDFGPQPLFLCAELGREFGAEVFRLEDGANLDLRLLARHRIGAALQPLERLVHRLDLPDPEARDELLRFGERSIDDALLAACEAHALALAAGVETFARLHDARLHELFVVLAHRGK